MTKVGTELLQAFKTMENALPDNVDVWFVSANFGSTNNTFEDVAPIMESLKEVGFTADKEKFNGFSEISQNFHHQTNVSWKFKIGLRWKATETDKIRNILEEKEKLQAKLNELNKLTAKDLDDIPEKEVI